MAFTMHLPLATMDKLCLTLLTSNYRDIKVCTEALKQTIQIHLRQSPLDLTKISNTQIYP